MFFSIESYIKYIKPLKMKKKALLLFILATATMWGNTQTSSVTPAKKQNQSTVLDSCDKKVSSLLNKLPNHSEISLVMISKSNETFYGAKKQNNSIQHLENSDRVFQIGSISKVFTSTLLSDLVKEEKLKLTDPIYKYLKVKKSNIKEVQLQQLANHTAGYPNMPNNLNLWSGMNPEKNYTEENLIEYLNKHFIPESKPGTAFAYSNVAVGILANVLSEAAKMDFEELLQTKIFSTYGMNKSSSRCDKLGDRVTGLDAIGNAMPCYDLNALTGAGGISSTVQDLTKFVKAQFDHSNEELALTRKVTHESNNTSIGLGWFIDSDSLKTTYMHNGAVGGYRSCMVFDTENNYGVVVLSNIGGNNPKAREIDRLCYELLDMLYKAENDN